VSGAAGTGGIRRRLEARLLPAGGGGRRLAWIALVDSIGTGVFWTSGALYFTRVVGLTPAEVGIGLSVANLAGLVAAIPIGSFIEPLGVRRSCVALQLCRALGYAAYCGIAFAPSFPAFLAVATCIGVTNTVVPPLNQAAVGLAVPAAARLDTLAKIRGIRNAGIGLGAACASIALSRESFAGFLLMILANAISFLAVAVLFQRMELDQRPDSRPPARPRPPVTDVRYLAAAVLNGVLSVHMTLLFVAFPLWIAARTPLPIWITGVLVGINTVMAATPQRRFAAGAETVPGAAGSMVRAGAALAGCALVAFALARVGLVWAAAGLAVLGVVLMTCGELWQSAGGWTLSYRLARPDRVPQYLITFQLGASIQSVAGPALVLGLVFPSRLGWLGLAATTVAAGLGSAWLVRPAATVEARAPRSQAG
jgi:hypothetical protein